MSVLGANKWGGQTFLTRVARVVLCPSNARLVESHFAEGDRHSKMSTVTCTPTHSMLRYNGEPLGEAFTLSIVQKEKMELEDVG